MTADGTQILTTDGADDAVCRKSCGLWLMSMAVLVIERGSDPIRRILADFELIKKCNAK
jgi:hypothetical protein